MRVRYLALRFLGKDIADAIVEIDEKPMHFNESGSKAAKTLAFAGDSFVGLHENHAGSRERLSMMTCGFSSKKLLKKSVCGRRLGFVRRQSRASGVRN
jgi:hypothetical protein